ncbi:Mis12-domain-containing protein, partial [Nadsonia fulvescens var. elongata DSM 6958]
HKAIHVLTEHFGYAPITVVDDIINAVNKFLYKCTDAIEKFLTQRMEREEQKRLQRENAGKKMLGGPIFRPDEIMEGTNKLETLMESIVDRNFDKFELYTLRNLFLIPADLIEGGWLRLEHQKNLIIPEEDSSKPSGDDLDRKIQELRRKIAVANTMNSRLIEQYKSSKKLEKTLGYYVQHMNSLVTSSPSSTELTELLNELTPLGDKIRYLIELAVSASRKLDDFNEAVNNLPTVIPSIEGSVRDVFLHTVAKRLSEAVG